MNVKAALDLLMSRAGNRSSAGLRAKILTEMVTVQAEELEHMPELPWFLISEQATAPTVAGESRILLPSDFIREVEDENLTIYWEDEKIQDVFKVGYDEGRVQVPDDADPGVPFLYSIRGNYIILRPTPDAEYVVRFPSYYARQEPPSDLVTSENEWMKNAADLVLAKTGVRLARYHLSDPRLETAFLMDQKTAEDKLVREMTAREEANRSRRMG